MGQQQVNRCEYVNTEFILVLLLIDCIVFRTNNCKPTVAPTCTIRPGISFSVQNRFSFWSIKVQLVGDKWPPMDDSSAGGT